MNSVPYSADRLAYPLTYRSWLGATYNGLLGAMFFAGGLLSAWSVSTRGLHPDIGTMLISAGLLGLGGYMLLSAFLTRVVLTQDAIESYGPFGSRRMMRAEIDGYRTFQPSRARAYILLSSKNAQERPVRADAAILKNPRCASWFEQIADLKDRDKAEQQAQIDAAEILGSTPQERRAKAKIIQRVTLALGAVGFLLWGLTFFADNRNPWILAGLLALLPAVFGWLWFTGEMLFFAPGVAAGNSIFARWTALIMLPAFAAVMMSWGHVAEPQSFQSIVLGVVAAGAGLMAVLSMVAKTEISKNFRPFLVSVAVSAVYLYGSFVSLNVALDRSRPTLLTARVAEMHVSSGRSTTYWTHLVFLSGTERNYAISRPLYRQLQVGKTACLGYWNGAFKVAWWDIVACPPQGS